MNTTKKNGFLKAAGLMLAVMMLAICALSGTMAKYKSEGTATVSATVAKWNITANSSEFADLDTLSFTVYDTVDDGGNYKTTDTHVKEATMIAPGTWGYATIEIENAGDVDATISATLSKGTLPAGMTIKLLTTAPSAPSEIDSEALTVSETQVNKNGGTLTVVVAFVWVFEGNETTDTPIGETGGSLTLGTLTVTAEQVD